MFSFLKSMSKSKTVIVNVLMVAAGTLGYLSGHEVIAQNPEVVAALVAVAGVVNVVLRFMTTLPIWDK